MVVNTPLVQCYVVGGFLPIRASYWRVWSTIDFFLSAFDQNVQQKKRKRPHTFVCPNVCSPGVMSNNYRYYA